jgi:hypothetical protein
MSVFIYCKGNDMSKYDNLGNYLAQQHLKEIPMTFAEIERITGAALPPKAQHHRAWWSNNPSNNVMTKVWLKAGYETSQVDIVGRKLVFKRIAREEKGASGMSEAHHEFTPAPGVAKSPRRSPLFGCMKGTFTIEPGYDLTSPMFTDEEWKEIEKEMDEDWDQIEQGMKGKK